MTGWGKVDDVAMTDADQDGVFEGAFKVKVTANMLTENGDIEFKVRADSKWDDSWGEYEADYDRTFNSQTNCKIEGVNAGDELTVKVTLDTNQVSSDALDNPDSGVNEDGFDNDAMGFNYWKVDYQLVEDNPDAAQAKQQLGDDLSGYYFFDNSYTQYDTVGAYWWRPSEGNGSWPGAAITKIEGTEVWALKFDAATPTIVFNNLVSDPDHSVDNPKCQTENEDVTAANAGQIFVPDPAKESIKEDGAVKMIGGAWEAFAGVDATEVVLPEEQSQASQDSQTSQDSQASQGSQNSQESSKKEAYETKVTDYIYYDNSETKWEKVYAYWWQTDYARTYDLEGKDYGCEEVENSDGTKGYNPTKFPGTALQQIPGTDIWQARIPFGATKIIFNSGKSDEEIYAGETGYQTGDLDFDQEKNAGQVYKINTSVEPTHKTGKEKTKWVYSEGDWSKYEGNYNKETIGEKVDPSKPAQQSSKASSPAAAGGSGSAAAASTAVDVPQTGDIAMAVAFIAVATAALGAVVLAAKKKRSM